MTNKQGLALVAVLAILAVFMLIGSLMTSGGGPTRPTRAMQASADSAEAVRDSILNAESRVRVLEHIMNGIHGLPKVAGDGVVHVTAEPAFYRLSVEQKESVAIDLRYGSGLPVALGVQFHDPYTGKTVAELNVWGNFVVH